MHYIQGYISESLVKIFGDKKGFPGEFSSPGLIGASFPPPI